ncbi:cryptochrome/photolyase family protein [uncultured Pseudokineococcus sp.]|uniref:cryptochrome/photolyase family protein n=1 Tax=uncultured Pseudokineococcus sp. TaxID=1642928 RepID=UPI00261A4436|nr:cryptochrome/photolyase family protein [uncultured Pseudokineococcus sp.]
MATAPGPTRWLFGDQLGPHFLGDVENPGDDGEQPVLLIESRKVFTRRRFHRQKAHLILSAMRHRAAELGDRCTYYRTDTYAEGLARLPRTALPLSVCSPTSRQAEDLVRSLDGSGDLPAVEVLPDRGYATSRQDFRRWADGTKQLLMEDFYRRARRAHGVLMDGAEPVGGTWNLDHENREPPPKGAETLGLPGVWLPVEDEIDEEVRADLDRWEADGDVSFVGRDGPRTFAASRAEALAALDDFVDHRLPAFGPHEDAILERDEWMAHSMLSAPMNLGLLDPLECVERAEDAHRAGDAPLASVEGYVRQIIGWRDYIWHVYWYAGADYTQRNALAAHEPIPQWFWELDADAVEARCLSSALRGVRDRGWVHHIPRLMVLGNYALQRGWDPAELMAWFQRSFVDGYDWVMAANVIGMSQHADGGLMATKPYASGGAYINRMSDHCKPCRYKPTVRVGEDACPFTAGYWWFLDRNAERLEGNFRMGRALQGRHRLKDLEALVEQERQRGSDAP